MSLSVKPLRSRGLPNNGYSRRRFLRFGLASMGSLAMLHSSNSSATTLLVPPSSVTLPPERTLSFVSLHTGESLKATYWSEGEYQIEELMAINHVLRDHRTGDVYPIDKNLLNLLDKLQKKVHGNKPFQVISGYRSPKTNAYLNKKSSGVAKKSLHMQGKAIDIRLPGCQLSDLRKAAIECQTGGVGYYSKSDFIHVDTGRVRRWGT